MPSRGPKATSRFLRQCRVNGRLLIAGYIWGALSGLAIGQTVIDLPALDLNPPDSLTVRIGGTTPGVEHDLYAITNSARLEGALILPFVNGYQPNLGDVVKFLEAGAIEQQFRSHFFPIAPPEDVAVQFSRSNMSVQAEFVRPQTDNVFTSNAQVASWQQAENWLLGQVPQSTLILDLVGGTLSPQRIEVSGGPQEGLPPAEVHHLRLRGAASPVTLAINAGGHFSSTVRTTVGKLGAIELAGGLLLTNELVVEPSGEVLLQQGRLRTGLAGTRVAGSFFGDGQVVGDFSLLPGGQLEIEDGDGNPSGSVVIQGNYQQFGEAVLRMDVDASDPGEFETLSITGDAAFDGRLQVDLSAFAGFDAGSVIPLISAGSIDLSAGFRQIDVIGNLPIGTYAGVQYTTTSASMVGLFVGDMNGDFAFDEVDVDLMVLALRDRQAYELTELPGGGIIGISADITGDTDFDGDLDFDDIDDFMQLLSPPAALYAERALLGVQVPEPSTLMLLGAACLLLAGTPRK